MGEEVLDKIKRILVTRTDRIGDVVLATPVLEALRKSYPRAFIAMMVRPYAREVIEGNPYVDEILLDDDQGEHKGLSGFRKLLSKVRERKFDAAIVLFPTLRSSLLVFLSGIPLRIGPFSKIYSLLFNQRLPQHRSQCLKHEVEYNLDLAKMLKVRGEGFKVKVFLSAEDREGVQKLLSLWGIKDESFIIIHPGSGGSARNWPLDFYARIGDALLKEGKVKVVITGAWQEKEIIDKLISFMENKPIVLMGETTIKQLAALISRAKLFLSSSTGPLHIAAAVGTPTVSLFCPIRVCGPKRWGPWGGDHAIFQPPGISCERCEPKKCDYYDCMRMIKPEEVLMTIRKRLKGNEGR